MDVATFVIAVVGLAVAIASAVWQTATYVLSNGRAKVTLLVGASNGRQLASGTPAQMGVDGLKRLIDQGIGRPVIGVKVRNVGRAAISVERWNLVHHEGLSLLGQAVVGPPLPCRIEAGASEMWMADMQEAIRFKAATDATSKPGELHGSVELGDGRIRKTRETLS